MWFLSRGEVPTGVAQGLCGDLCHRLWLQTAEQAAVPAAVPELPGEMGGMDELCGGLQTLLSSDGVTGKIQCR